MTARHPIPDAALEHHMAVLGKTGSGKSYAAQGIVERLIKKRARVCLIDPTDRYWGLRLDADGKKPSGHEVVIFGGQRADLPLAETHGATLAEIVGTTATPVIISTRLMTVGQRTRFFSTFAETLLAKNEGPLHLVIDEAHLFAPQTKVASVESGQLLHATNNLVSLGRGIGLRIMLLSQRPAKLHKDSLTQVETLVAMRMIAPQDRNAIREWVREWADEATGAEMMSSLPSLPTGTAWVWAPELDILRKVEFPTIETFDSGRPQAATKARELGRIDLAKVSAKLETVAQEAKANDPKALKAEIARLKAALEKASKTTQKGVVSAADADVIAKAEERGFNQAKKQLPDAAERELQTARAQLIEKFCTAIAPVMALLKDELAAARKRPDLRQSLTFTPSGSPGVTSVPIAPKRAESHETARRVKPLPVASGNGALSGSEQKIINAIRWWNVLGVAGPSHAQVAFIAGYSHKSGTWATYLSRLRSAGMIEGRGDLVLTDEGAAIAHEPDVPPSGEHLREVVLDKLDGPLAKILEPIIEAYPNALTHAEAAGVAGYSHSSGTWATYLSRLRSLDLIEGRGDLQAQEWMFP
jgi:hypothetical protein